MSDLQVYHAGTRRLASARFSDADEMSEAVGGWELDLRQLDRGPGSAELVQVVTPSIVMLRSRLRRGRAA